MTKKSEPRIGQIIHPGTGAERDAVHIAVLPATADEKLYPSQGVSIAKIGDSYEAISSKDGIGIVDPYLASPLWPGDKFWVFIYPRTITSLRHAWEHPVIDSSSTSPDAETINKSKAWLEEFAAECGFTAKEVLDAAEHYARTGEHYIQKGDDSARSALWATKASTFWKHYGIITGFDMDHMDDDDVFFCCSC